MIVKTVEPKTNAAPAAAQVAPSSAKPEVSTNLSLPARLHLLDRGGKSAPRRDSAADSSRRYVHQRADRGGSESIGAVRSHDEGCGPGII